MEAGVPAREVMDREFVGVSESDTVVETAEVMVEEDATVAVVLHGNESVGVVTERDALAALVDGRGDAAVTDVMTGAVPTVDPDASLDEATDVMSAEARSYLVVTEGNEPVGVVTERDLVATVAYPGRSKPTERTAASPAAAGGASTEAGTGETTREYGGQQALGRDSRSEDESAEGYEDQSICEVCGSFSRDLAAFNGQLLCADCRDI